jgi:hypothetical protein
MWRKLSRHDLCVVVVAVKIVYKMLFEERKSGIAGLVAEVWQLKGITRNRVKRRCPLCLGEEDMKRILLDCLRTRN